MHPSLDAKTVSERLGESLPQPGCFQTSSLFTSFKESQQKPFAFKKVNNPITLDSSSFLKK